VKDQFSQMLHGTSPSPAKIGPRVNKESIAIAHVPAHRQESSMIDIENMYREANLRTHPDQLAFAD
jgi:hypothetical protein